MNLQCSKTFSITLNEHGQRIIGPTEPIQGSYYLIKVLGDPCRMKVGFACPVETIETGQDSFLAYYWVKIGVFCPDYAQIIPIPSWAQSWYFAVEFWPGKRYSAEPKIAIHCP